MDKKQHNQQQNSLGGGFLLGLVLGVLITLLFSTKRGRELLKEWTEKGINKLSDLETMIKEQTEKENKQPEAPENDYIQKDQKQKEQERKLIAQEAEIIDEKPKTVSQPQIIKKEEPKPAPTPKPAPKPEIHPAWKPVEPPVSVEAKPVEVKKEEKPTPSKPEKKQEEVKPKKSPIKRFFKRK
jgi:gas vesicle protein